MLKLKIMIRNSMVTFAMQHTDSEPTTAGVLKYRRISIRKKGLRRAITRKVRSL